MAETRPDGKLAFYDLRDYWLSDTRVRELLNADNRNTINGQMIKPFFPVAQQPETEYPYFRYNIDRIIGYPQWWMHTETVGLELFAEDLDDSNEIINLFIDMAGQQDRSAHDLQDWLVSEGRDINFMYHYIEWIGGGEMEASTEEGGSVGRTLNFAIAYSPLRGRRIA